MRLRVKYTFCACANFTSVGGLSLVPRPHLPNDRKSAEEGAPGTFCHVTDVKVRRHGRGFPLAKRCTNARLRDRAQKLERRRVLARGRYKSVLVLVPAPG